MSVKVGGKFVCRTHTLGQKIFAFKLFWVKMAISIIIIVHIKILTCLNFIAHVIGRKLLIYSVHACS